MQRTGVAFSILSKAILVAGAYALAIFVIPQAAFAASTLHWKPFTENPNTGDRAYGTTLSIQDAGNYEAPLNQLGEALIETDLPVFGTDGVLFYIRNPESRAPTREFVASFGEFFSSSDIAFPQSGVYELDIYESEPLMLVNDRNR